MSYLLDTNVISELFRAMPHASVAKWIKMISPDETYISVLTLGEIRKGVEKLQDSNRKQKINHWLEHDLKFWFEDRLLPVTEQIAHKWGFLAASMDRPLPVLDTLLAATALVHNLKLVTRNVKDFIDLPIEVINPWQL